MSWCDGSECAEDFAKNFHDSAVLNPVKVIVRILTAGRQTLRVYWDDEVLVDPALWEYLPIPSSKTAANDVILKLDTFCGNVSYQADGGLL